MADDTNHADLGQSPKKNNKKLIAVVLLAIILAWGGILGYAFYNAHETGNTAYIGWTVSSTHLTETVDVVIYIDGHEINSYKGLGPGHIIYNEYYYNYHFSKSSDHKVIEIKAVSFGGGLGQQIDTEQLLVYDGEKYNIKLRV